VSKPRLWTLSILGLVLPVSLAFAAYLMSSSSLGDADVLRVPQVPVATGNPELVVPTPESSPTTKPKSVESPGEDVSGKCDEAEHANDPECVGGTSTSSSGSGSGGSSADGSGDDHGGSRSGDSSGTSGGSNSGSGSSGSGSGGGDDSSHSGRGGGDD
jgi:hypothetical protein